MTDNAGNSAPRSKASRSTPSTRRSPFPLPPPAQTSSSAAPITSDFPARCQFGRCHCAAADRVGRAIRPRAIGAAAADQCASDRSGRHDRSSRVHRERYRRQHSPDDCSQLQRHRHGRSHVFMRDRAGHPPRRPTSRSRPSNGSSRRRGIRACSVRRRNRRGRHSGPSVQVRPGPRDFSPTSNLSCRRSHTWQIVAVDRAGNTRDSTGGNRTFTVDLSAPDEPTITDGPQPNSGTSDPTPTFTWATLSGATYSWKVKRDTTDVVSGDAFRRRFDGDAADAPRRDLHL